MPTGTQPLEHTQNNYRDKRATDKAAVKIFPALLIADAIRAAGQRDWQAITEATSKR